jgi:hypothetical protein
MSTWLIIKVTYSNYFNDIRRFLRFPCRWADKLESENSAGEVKPFNHPFLQACTMFIGESLCLLVFTFSQLYKKRKQVYEIFKDLRA